VARPNGAGRATTTEARTRRWGTAGPSHVQAAGPGHRRTGRCSVWSMLGLVDARSGRCSLWPTLALAHARPTDARLSRIVPSLSFRPRRCRTLAARRCRRLLLPPPAAVCRCRAACLPCCPLAVPRAVLPACVAVPPLPVGCATDPAFARPSAAAALPSPPRRRPPPRRAATRRLSPATHAGKRSGHRRPQASGSPAPASAPAIGAGKRPVRPPGKHSGHPCRRASRHPCRRASLPPDRPGRARARPCQPLPHPPAAVRAARIRWPVRAAASAPGAHPIRSGTHRGRRDFRNRSIRGPQVQRAADWGARDAWPSGSQPRRLFG
jgi:hypothetical protein